MCFFFENVVKGGVDGKKGGKGWVYDLKVNGVVKSKMERKWRVKELDSRRRVIDGDLCT